MDAIATDSRLLGRADQLRQALIAGSAIAIYGAGGFGARVAAALRIAGLPASAFLDAHKAGAQHDGLPVIGLQGDAPRGILPGRTAVVIGVFNPGVDIAALTAQLRQLGWASVINPIELIVALGERAALDTYWMVHPARHDAADLAAARSARELFADESSRELFDQQVQLRLEGDFAVLPKPFLGDSYFPKDVPPVAGDVCLVDCGSFVGDTLNDFVARGISLKRVAAFEPDPRNFAELAVTARKLSARGIDIAAYPCGVGDTVGTVRFSAGLGASSTISDSGDIVVTVVPIDDALPGFPATFVKMDIEGAEAAALRGARRMIETHRPRLAISAYHRPDDIWRLPALVREIRDDYQLYLRVHTFNGFETVLYAV